MATRKARRSGPLLRQWTAVLLCMLPLWSAAVGTARDQRSLTLGHDAAVTLFRQARFAEAYGRFVELAEAGHLKSARYALWMCENGQSLFGRVWDCSPSQIEDWARLSGIDPREAVQRIYPDQRQTGAASSAQHLPRR